LAPRAGPVHLGWHWPALACGRRSGARPGDGSRAATNGQAAAAYAGAAAVAQRRRIDCGPSRALNNVNGIENRVHATKLDLLSKPKTLHPRPILRDRRPDVFSPTYRVPGSPHAMEVERVVGGCARCPSAPSVPAGMMACTTNRRLCQSGEPSGIRPVRVQSQLELDGEPSVFAPLCRCGASKNQAVLRQLASMMLGSTHRGACERQDDALAVRNGGARHRPTGSTSVVDSRQPGDHDGTGCGSRVTARAVAAAAVLRSRSGRTHRESG